jgi:NADH-quinone oxidoreductase subunit L
MLDWLWLVPALPLAGFALLALSRGCLADRAVAVIGAASVGLTTVLAFWLAWHFPGGPGEPRAFHLSLWRWIPLDGTEAPLSLYLDPLSLVMMLVVSGVGFLIHLYAIGFMRGDAGFTRFFAEMNLFLAFMLLLVLAGDLLVLFLGWEGVGLCSYLLIGHWYRDPANGRAARKAFVVTRVGDAALLAGVLLLISQFGSSDIPTLLRRATADWPVGSGLAVLTAALFLGGAVGKSAQLPLQVWLPDAMAGPTPVSALIHAATMVTAGVYLIARTHALFVLAPPVQMLVAVIGLLTLLLGALSALAQHDLKRALAWSTLSQVGYMFLALGVGALSAALFHLVTHAFFKALLFLAAGMLIHALGGNHDMRRMGGLAGQRPLELTLFLVGCASLAALPWVTAGFYSKEAILLSVWNADSSGWLWAGAVLGTLLTALYAFRMLFLVFFGETRTPIRGRPGWIMSLPASLLAALALGGGLLGVPDIGAPRDAATASGGWLPKLAAIAASILGAWLAYRLYLRRSAPSALQGSLTPARVGFGFDRLYTALLERPYLWLARVDREDLLNLPYQGLAALTRWGHGLMSRNQSGILRWYATATVLGAALLLGTALLLTGDAS